MQRNLTDYLIHVLHVFAENAIAKKNNNNLLIQLTRRLISIPSKDEVPKNCNASDMSEVQNRKQSETGGLAILLKLKVNASVIITTNIDNADRLINKQIEVAKYIEIKQNEVAAIYLDLDDKYVGQARKSEWKLYNCKAL